MANTIFEALLFEKIAFFKSSFSQLSTKVFYDEEQAQLIHPGEYGMFRESICKEFIRFVVPRSLNIDQGFIINPNNKISTQCDILIYDSNVTPLIENTERQRFFPVESICAVGEVKSTLSKGEFKKAINKLSKVKALKHELKDPFVLKSENKSFDPEYNWSDNIVSFLICQKLDFDLKHLCDDMTEFYEEGNFALHHNLVLSVEDGVFLYSDNGRSVPYPCLNGQRLKNRLIPADKNDLHLKIFCNNLFLTTSSFTLLFPEIANYMSTEGLSNNFIDQSK